MEEIRRKMKYYLYTFHYRGFIQSMFRFEDLVEFLIHRRVSEND